MNLQVEAAKSGRAGCKTCKNKIDKDVMRIGKVRRSPSVTTTDPACLRQEFDNGQYTSVSWHHLTCFNLSKVATGDDLAGFSLLSAAQQTEVAARLGQPGQKRSAPLATATAGPKPKKAKTAVGPRPTEVNADEEPYADGVSLIEYAKAKKVRSAGW